MPQVTSVPITHAVPSSGGASAPHARASRPDSGGQRQREGGCPLTLCAEKPKREEGLACRCATSASTAALSCMHAARSSSSVAPSAGAPRNQLL